MTFVIAGAITPYTKLGMGISGNHLTCFLTFIVTIAFIDGSLYVDVDSTEIESFVLDVTFPVGSKLLSFNRALLSPAKRELKKYHNLVPRALYGRIFICIATVFGRHILI